MQKINFGYIYKTTNLVNNKIYIGQKKGEFNSDYLGSGILLKQAINMQTSIIASEDMKTGGPNKKERRTQ